jgi:hypothetical protein
MLQDYKDEVDTLNEALKIAALDIAEVAQAEDDFFLSDEEGDEEGEGEDSDLMSTDMSASLASEDRRGRGLEASSNASFASNDTAHFSSAALHKKEELYKEALRDETKKKSAAPKSQRSTFVINENGSFQKS